MASHPSRNGACVEGLDQYLSRVTCHVCVYVSVDVDPSRSRSWVQTRETDLKEGDTEARRTLVPRDKGHSCPRRKDFEWIRSREKESLQRLSKLSFSFNTEGGQTYLL